MKKLLYFLIIIFMFSLTSCSHKTNCEGKWKHKSSHVNNRKYSYDKKYSQKTKPVKKDYVIRNGIAR